MKSILGILVLVVIAGGAWYLYDKKTSEGMDDVMKNDAAAMEGGAMMNDADGDGDEKAMEDGSSDTMMKAEVGVDVSAGEVMNDVKTFDVKGVNFAFDVKEIRVKKGDKVTINFESSEGFHDWVVDEFKAATKQVNPGTPTSVTFVADKAGTFEYYCSVGKHRQNGMVGKLIVE